MEEESDGGNTSKWCARYNHKRVDEATGKLGNKKTSGDYLNYSIFKIGQNTTKSPVNLKRVAVNQTIN